MGPAIRKGPRIACFLKACIIHVHPACVVLEGELMRLPGKQDVLLSRIGELLQGVRHVQGNRGRKRGVIEVMGGRA